VGAPDGSGRVAYRPTRPSPVRAEVQRLDGAHEVRGYGPHAHTDFFEFVLFDRAGGSHAVGRRAHEVVPGQVLCLPPGVTHDCAELGEAEGWLLLFTAEAVGAAGAVGGPRAWPRDPLLAAFQGPEGTGTLLSPTADRLSSWTSSLARVAAEQTHRPAQHAIALRAILHLLLVDVARMVDPAPAVDLPAAPLLAEVFDVLERRYRQPGGLAEVAGEVHRSPAHVAESVRRATGRSVGEWLVERRMVDARRLLLDSDLPVAAVGRQVGYDDEAHFARSFRRAHGTPPGRWRREAREDPPIVLPSPPIVTGTPASAGPRSVEQPGRRRTERQRCRCRR